MAKGGHRVIAVNLHPLAIRAQHGFRTHDEVRAAGQLAQNQIQQLRRRLFRFRQQTDHLVAFFRNQLRAVGHLAEVSLIHM